MKQQVRLRMLIPLVVVAVAGLAVWKFVLSGGDAEPAASDPVGVLDATVPGASSGPEAVPAADAPDAEAPAQAKPAGEWVAELDAICERFDAAFANVPTADKPSEVAGMLARTEKVARSLVAEVDGLAVPKADLGRLSELTSAWTAELANLDKVLAALETGEYTRAFTLLDKADRLDRKSSRMAADLGAKTFAELGEDDAAADEEPTVDAGTYAIATSLEERKVVVAVLYSPDADVDALALREARAGAQAARAGFVAIDGTRDAAVRVFAPALDLRETPAILVFRKGSGVLTRLDGFADRQTVAQAVTNAKAPA